MDPLIDIKLGWWLRVLNNDMELTMRILLVQLLRLPLSGWCYQLLCLRGGV
jgi:hypothetical protein